MVSGQLRHRLPSLDWPWPVSKLLFHHGCWTCSSPVSSSLFMTLTLFACPSPRLRCVGPGLRIGKFAYVRDVDIVATPPALFPCACACVTNAYIRCYVCPVYL